MQQVYEDLYNLFCGKLIGEGIHRKVFECKIRPDLVVKVESDDYRHFANVLEMRFWNDYSYSDKVKKWLAPCEFLSPDGRILLQKRCDPIPSNYKLPDKLPEFLTDIKKANFGLLNGKLVCVDYAYNITDANDRLRKANW